MLRALILLGLISPAPAFAQDPVQIDLPALIALVSEPWRDAVGFEAELAESLPRLRILRDEVSESINDPMAWLRDGEFAAIPGIVPVGGYVFCARVGIATRDALVEGALNSRARFDLYSRYLIESDLIAAWPEAAIARLSCQITWDDTRAVSILSEMQVNAVLTDAFATLRDTQPSGQDAFYGPDGYRLLGRSGVQNSLVILDQAEVVLTRRHQALRIRSFLLNAGT